MRLQAFHSKRSLTSRGPVLVALDQGVFSTRDGFSYVNNHYAGYAPATVEQFQKLWGAATV